MTKQSATVHVPITMLGSTWKGNVSLPPNQTFDLQIDYPMERVAIIPCVFGGVPETFRPAAQRALEDDWRTSKDKFFAEWNKRNLARGQDE